MEITLNNLIPEPLVGTSQSGSGLWLQNKITFLQQQVNLVLSSSGRGKTSLVSFMYGVRKDYQGSLLLDNKEVNKLSFEELTELRKHKLSIVFQDLRLFDKLTAIENIQLKNQLTNFRSHQEIVEMAEQLEVDQLLIRPVNTLSYGQQQRIAIIRSLCQPMEWLFLDEPFSHLDLINIQKAWNLITQETQKQNTGTILTLLNPLDCVVPFQTIHI